MTTQVVYSKDFLRHDNEGHPENAGRLITMFNEIKNSSLKNILQFAEPEMLPEEYLYKIHSERMIDQIKEISTTGKSWIDLDTYVCIDDYEISRLAAGGVLMACNRVMDGEIDNVFVLTRPPGHHATRERSMGFCLFNNAAIAADQISKKGKRILIFDPDVHHGNGTMDIFYDRKDVMYQSIHLSPHYPGTGDIDETGVGEGQGYTVNAPLSYGMGDQTVKHVLDEVFLPIASQFKPDLIIFSTGYDSHHSDPLGGLRLTSNIYGEMLKKYQKIQPNIVCTLEGGYNLNWIGKCLVSQLGQMADHKIKIKDSCEEKFDFQQILTSLKNELGKYWKI